MANNKVIANGETLIDLTEDTVTASNMVSGIVAHDASGARIVGTFDPSIFVQKSGDTMTGDLECPRVYKNYDAGEYYTEYDLSSINGLGLRMYADDHSMYGAFCKQTRLSSQQVFISDGDGTEMYPITNSVALGYNGIIFENNNAITKLDDSNFIIADKDILRTHQSLVGGYGTAIPANADLNTVTYSKVGRYFCAQNATAATLANSPTTAAFMMEVFAPVSDTIDDESTGSYVYRIRRITAIGGTGSEYIQYVSGGNGNFTYRAWKIISGSVIGSWTTATASPNVTFDTAQCYVKQVDSTVYIHIQIIDGIPSTNANVVRVSGVPMPVGSGISLRGSAITGAQYYQAYHTAHAILASDGNIFLRKDPTYASDPTAIIDFIYPAY